MRPDQVFIVGMNGSGTTMLLDCLAGHSLLFGFHGETKALPYYIRNQVRFGDLSIDSNFAKLWRELRNSIGGRGWRNGADAAWSRGLDGKRRSAAAIFDAVMTTLAARECKRIWCEKTPMYVHNMKELADAFPSAKFIHVIRDGRDCAASFHRRWHFNPLRTIFRWKQAIRAGRTQGAELGCRYREVRYEQLTLAPEEILHDLCAFLEVPFEVGILSQARSRPEMSGSTENSITPNSRRADLYFEPSVLKLMEVIAGRLLLECGYPPYYLAGDSDPRWWRIKWWELQDDCRRLGEAIRASSEVQGPGRFTSLSRRVAGALRQKSSSR